MYVRVGIQLSDRAFPWQVQNSLMRKTECWYEWYVFAVSILMVSVLQRSWLELGERAYLVQGGPLCPLNFIRTTVWTLHSCFKETVLQLQGVLHLRQATAPNPDVPHSQSFQTKTGSAWEDHSRRDEPWRLYMIPLISQAGQSEEHSPVT